ncbi:MAG: YlbF family regulator [Syntrophomonadaceae bacterium]|nr:YlbF family regulator [Syntrophomonadaceae bacterium]
MPHNGNPYNKAHELADAIKASEMFTNYLAAKQQLEEKPELKEKIINLRQRQMEMNRRQMLGEEIKPEEVQEISLEYAKTNQIKGLGEFLKAEGVFIQMFNDIQEIIQKAIESEFR